MRALMEVAHFMRVDEKSPIFGSKAKPAHDMLFERAPLLTLASCRATARAAEAHEASKALPTPGSEGVKRGRRPLVQPEQTPQLNEGAHECIGKVDTKKDLVKGVIAIAKQRSKQQGVGALAPAPS